MGYTPPALLWGTLLLKGASASCEAPIGYTTHHEGGIQVNISCMENACALYIKDKVKQLHDSSGRFLTFCKTKFPGPINLIQCTRCISRIIFIRYTQNQKFGKQGKKSLWVRVRSLLCLTPILAICQSYHAFIFVVLL